MYDDEGNFDITDFYGPVDEDDEIDRDDLLDERGKPTTEKDSTASVAPGEDDADGKDEDEDGDEDFSAF